MNKKIDTEYFNNLKERFKADFRYEIRLHCINDYKNFEENISAYIDNELEIDEAIKIKKFLIKNQYAKKNFEEINKIIMYIKSENEEFKKRIHIKEKIKNLILYK